MGKNSLRLLVDNDGWLFYILKGVYYWGRLKHQVYDYEITFIPRKD